MTTRLMVCFVLALAGIAHADAERFAVVIGNNAGASDERTLRFAESDAARVGDVLGDLGGVRAENQIVLRGKSADEARRALIATNERIRTEQQAGRDTLLVVYYSGHGDADALHLGESRFALREVEALVRGSPANIRILIVDSCRSGAVTRVKGGRPAPPLTVFGGEPSSEGVIVLTASTAGEDAQESDQLAGSFFTHYLVSALRGAADDDGDQRVTVAEAFSYTREQTIIASSRTLAGTQHPTFHYDLRGRAEVPLVDLGSARGRGRLTVPEGATWLVIAGSSTGNVVGEISTSSPRRTLSLRPGRYAVRGRTRDALLEGSVAVAADRETRVDPSALDRTTYARLVRKGGADVLDLVAGPFGGLLVQSPIIDGASACLGGVVGWTWVRADLSLSPRLAGCRSESDNRTLSATSDALSLDLRLSKAWDLSRLTIDLGLTAGGALLQQRFETRGLAPTRTSAAAHVDASVGAALPLGRSYVATEIAAQTHFFSHEEQDGSTGLVARFAVRALVAFGVWL